MVNIINVEKPGLIDIKEQYLSNYRTKKPQEAPDIEKQACFCKIEFIFVFFLYSIVCIPYMSQNN